MASETKIDEVVEELYQRISQGIYKAGERLPAERDLAQEMGMSRQTVHSAMLRLQAESRIDIRPRDGAFVRAPAAKALVGPAKPLVKGKDYVSLFTNALQMQRNEFQSRFIEPQSIVIAEPELAQKLEVEVGSALLRTYQMYLVNQVPYRTVEIYLLASLLQFLGAELPVREQPIQEPKQPTQEKTIVGQVLARGTQVKIQAGTYQPETGINKPGENKPLDQPEFEMLFDAKQEASPYAFERFNCRMPSSQEAELLHMSRNQPVVDIERWTWLSNHMLFEYEHIVANALLHEYTYVYHDKGNYEELSHRQSAGS